MEQVTFVDFTLYNIKFQAQIKATEIYNSNGVIKYNLKISYNLENKSSIIYSATAYETATIYTNEDLDLTLIAKNALDEIISPKIKNSSFYFNKYGMEFSVKLCSFEYTYSSKVKTITGAAVVGKNPTVYYPWSYTIINENMRYLNLNLGQIAEEVLINMVISNDMLKTHEIFGKTYYTSEFIFDSVMNSEVRDGYCSYCSVVYLNSSRNTEIGRFSIPECSYNYNSYLDYYLKAISCMLNVAYRGLLYNVTFSYSQNPENPNLYTYFYNITNYDEYQQLDFSFGLTFDQDSAIGQKLHSATSLSVFQEVAMQKFNEIAERGLI